MPLSRENIILRSNYAVPSAASWERVSMICSGKKNEKALPERTGKITGRIRDYRQVRGRNGGCHNEEKKKQVG